MILVIFAISFLVTDRLRYVMIVSIPDTIPYQEVERKLFLKKNYGEVLNLKVKAIIARERLPNYLFNGCKMVLSMRLPLVLDFQLQAILSAECCIV